VFLARAGRNGRQQTATRALLTPSANGVWDFDFTATLPEGTWAFTASLAGLTSDPMPDFLITVDLSPPAVNLTVPSGTVTTLAPKVRVTASDDTGLPNPTPPLYPAGITVTLDVDKNNGGNFTDPGESCATSDNVGRLKG
jgi:hypothetical protein